MALRDFGARLTGTPRFALRAPYRQKAGRVPQWRCAILEPV
jgi:hypothetical protein